MALSAAKEYFAQYLADDVVRPLNEQLVEELWWTNPTSIFEFGCGQGKNLNLIKQKYPKVKVSGIDVSRKAVDSAHSKGRKYVELGDEHTLASMRANSCSVAFTCSVLDHVDVDWVAEKIVRDLQRIARDAVLLLETDRHSPSTYYYFHDYEMMGFTRLRWQYYSVPTEGGDGSVYYMYRWEKNPKSDGVNSINRTKGKTERKTRRKR